MRPKLDHKQAVNEVNRINSALKTAKAIHEKAHKLQSIFTEMAVKAGY
jgi:hypothetical protein